MQEQIKKLIEEELERVNAKFGPFNSAHEGWAVLREEVEEAEEEFESIEYAVVNMWRSIRGIDQTPGIRDSVDEIYKKAVTLASEAIQVGAMAAKMAELLKKQASYA